MGEHLLDEEYAIRGCQEGDSESFRFVVEQYGKVLYGTAYMMTKSQPQAEDLVQEALLLAWRNITGFRLGTNFKAWLIRILVNRVISEQRKKQVPLTEIEDVEETLATHDTVVEEALQSEERELIRGCLNNLNPEQRQAVVLRYYADLGGSEIAKILGCAERTVRTRIFRAKAQLLTCLSNKGIESVSVFD